MNIIITKEDLKKINFFLNKVVSSSLAHSVLLIDRSGQLITQYGNTLDIDVLFHKGRSENVYFTGIGDHVIMVTLFDDKTSLGLIRLRINQIADDLSNVLISIFEGKKVIPLTETEQRS
jgi:hypothetical protein